jgi:hypothetical protein
MEMLLLCLAALIVIVIVTYAAVRLCNLEEVGFHANILKYAAVTFSVKSRPPRDDASTQPPVPRKHRGQTKKGS